MSPLNHNQIRRVEATFTHVDSLLQSIEHVTRGSLSPFARERPDLTPDEARLIESFITLARARMLGALNRLGIPRPEGKLSARWSAGTALTFADTALSELGASDLAGYGAVDAASAAELEALAMDLRSLMQRARQVLHEHEVGGLATRIAGIPGASGDVLRAIEAVSREHGLAEVRPLLAAAVERATGTTFDVGVFGRVSAGKSSLINAIVGVPVLPVGATPVTAVPLRLARGESAATVHLLDGTTHEIALVAIVAYATEEQNPENRMGVRAIEITVPSVPEGLRLLDTPGVGSLKASGPASAFAWLPRCDLGLVLIAGGTAVGRDELALATGLHHAGIRCVVLVSKGDMLSPDEVEQTVSYVQQALSAALGESSEASDDGATPGGSTVEVHAVSTRVGAVSRLEDFRRVVLEPLARDHARLAKRALSTRLDRLVATTAAAMVSRRPDEDAVGAGSDAPDTDAVPVAAPPAGAADDRTVRVQIASGQAMATLREVTDRIDDTAPLILRAAADAIVAAWGEGRDGQEAARAAIIGSASHALRVVRNAIDRVRTAASADASTIGSARDSADWSGRRRVPPLFDPDVLDTLVVRRPPTIVRRLLGRTVALHRLEAIAEPLHVALERYGRALYEWGRGAVDELAIGASDGSWSATHDDAATPAMSPRVPELDAARRALAALHASTD
jgi:predicted GTPase